MKVNIGKYHKHSSNRKVNIQVDGYDTYSLENTLALVILPALMQLRQTMHGVPTDFCEVGGEDYHEQTCFDFYKEDLNDMFAKRCEAWNETLEKMIWSFQQIALEDYEDKYHHGKGEYDWVESDKLYPNPISGKMEKTFQMVDKNPDEHWYDFVGQLEHEKRIQEGLDLFGKYFQHCGIDMTFVFGHMVQELSTDAFKDEGFERITQQEFDIFLKEFVFEKLKGKKLGQSFAEKFNVKDRVLYIFSQDIDAIDHIKYCNYIK